VEKKTKEFFSPRPSCLELGLYLYHQASAVHIQRCAGHVSRQVRGQEEAAGGYLIHVPDPAQGDRLFKSSSVPFSCILFISLSELVIPGQTAFTRMLSRANTLAMCRVSPGPRLWKLCNALQRSGLQTGRPERRG